MDSDSAAFGEQTLQVGDLGRFSMRAIYDALATTTTQSTASLPIAKRPQYFDPEDSDCSWTQDDDNGTFYFDMQKRLNAFAAPSNLQPTMTTVALTKAQRRFVHATAQILRLGHASLGPPGKLRRMIVFKDPGDARALLSSSTSSSTVAHAEPSPAPPTRKRRRLERVENGFPCTHCAKVFSRASERRKHEQAHQPNLTSRFPCPVCGRGFRYPKDLRRHSRVHDKAQAAAAATAGTDGTTSLSSSLDSAASAPPLLGSSTLTADSRVPSDTSLAFSSACASKNVSPTLCGLADDGRMMGVLDLEPFVLDESLWAVAQDAWLFDPKAFGDGEGGLLGGEEEEEEGLEMVRVRR